MKMLLLPHAKTMNKNAKTMKTSRLKFHLHFDKLAIHDEMMRDHVRLDHFRDAIKSVVKPGDTVAEVGVGTGILSMMAAKSGAKKVYAIERTQIIDVARQIAKQNGYGKTIEFIHQDTRETELPEKVDVIISECLGDMAIQENLISDVLNFRSRWLKPSGTIMPLDATLYFGPVNSEKAYDGVSVWDRILERYGYNYAQLRNVAANSNRPTTISLDDFLSPPKESLRIDMVRDTEVSFSDVFRFPILKCGTIHGIAGYFQTSLSRRVVIDTSPKTNTHWEQSFFPMYEPRQVKPGDEVIFRIDATLHRASVDWNWEIGVNDGELEQHSTSGIISY